MKQRKRIAAFVLAAAMVFSTLPMNALAVENPNQNTSGLCEHHTEHTPECGYAPAAAEMPCQHTHDETCGYVAAVEEVPCDMGCTDTDGDGLIDHQEGCAYAPEAAETPCKHTHDTTCGYIPAMDEQPCKYVCEFCNTPGGDNAGQTPDGGQEQCSCITLCTEGNTNPACPVCTADLTVCKGTPPQPEKTCTCDTLCTEGAVKTDCPICGVGGADLTLCIGKAPENQVVEAVTAVQEKINALPEAESITEENLESVKTQLAEIDAAKAELDETQQAALNMEKYNAAVERIAAIEAKPQKDPANTQQAGNDVATVTIDGVETPYPTLEAAIEAADGKTATITVWQSTTEARDIYGGNITLELKNNCFVNQGINVYGGVIKVIGEGKLTQLNNGSSINESSGEIIIEGEVTITTLMPFNGKTTVAEGAIVSLSHWGGTTIITGGVISALKGSGNIIVKAGTIKIIDQGTTLNYVPDSVTLDQSELSLQVKEQKTLSATVTPNISAPGFPVWESSNTDVATVSNGTVTAVAPGDATITVKAGEKTATCSVTVTEDYVATVTIDGVETGYPTLAAAIEAANGNTATITLLQSIDKIAGEYYDGIKGGNITLNLNGYSVGNPFYIYGGSIKVIGEGKLHWISFMHDTEAVIESGNITNLTAASSGKVTIAGGDVENFYVNVVGTAIITGGTIHVLNGEHAGSGSITVKGGTIESIADTVSSINYEVENVTLDQSELLLQVNEQKTLTATVTPNISAPGFPVWESSNEAVATVSNGTVTAVAPGEVTITVIAGNKSAKCKVTVGAVASVTIGGQTQDYTNLDDAAKAVSKSGGKLTLLKDVSGRIQPLELSGPMTFDLGGHTLSGSWDDGAQGVVLIKVGNVQVTNGKVKTEAIATRVVNVEKGAILSGDAEYLGNVALRSKGTVSGGTFKGDCLIFEGTISGGIFEKYVGLSDGKIQGGCFKEADVDGGYNGLAEGLVAGYVGYDNDGVVVWHHQTQGDRLREFTGEVKAHTPHQSHWVEDKPASHTETGIQHEVCDICGYTGPSVTIPMIKHSFIWTANGNDTHTGTCSCGAVKTENCNYTDGKCSHCGYVDVAISLQPESLTVQEGEKAVFRITAAGDKLSYQWQKHGASGWEDIPGATADSYTIPSAAMEISGSQYRCVVFNGRGDSAASAAAILTVQKAGETENVITIELPTFDPVYAGYTQPDSKRINIHNSSDKDVMFGISTANSKFKLTFDVAPDTNKVPAHGTNTCYSLRPVSGLSPGEYTSTITVTSNDTHTVIATATASFTVLPQPTSEDDRGDGGSSDRDDGDATIVKRPNVDEPNIPTIAQSEKVKADNKGNVVITKPVVTAAIDKAKDDAKKHGNQKNGIAVEVPVEIGKKPDGVQITLKADALKKLTASNVKRFTIDTDSMTDFGFTLDTLKELNRQTNGDIVLKVRKTTVTSVEAKAAIGTRPAYDISLWEVKNGKETKLTDLNGKTISIAIPYTPKKNEQPGNLYAVSVDAAGKVQWITKSSYDADQKAVIFELTQPGIYGVGYDAKTPAFTDIENHWAKDNILFVVSRGLFSGTSATTFSPDTGMTRGMFVTALGRLAGINPESYQSGKFTDVKADAYYAPYVNWAAKTGIVSGTTDTTFAPDTNINREQMAVIMKNYAAKLGYTIPKTLKAVTFADNASISSWAKEAVKSMQQAGILAGKTNNRFDPAGTATRAEVATVLRRFVEIVIDPQTANGWQQNDSGEWSYYKNGEPVKGWLSDDQKWYWLDKATGKMFSNGWKQIDGKQYYFYADGSMAINTTVDGYAVGADGARVK